MWYVIQTLGGEEERTARLIQKIIPSCYMKECFVPKRERMKKFHGSWNKVDEILFQGYVFVISDRPEELYQELKQIPKLTRILGNEGNYFTPLNREEEWLVQRIGNKYHRAEISKVQVLEGKKVSVIQGPLKNYIGNVVKVDLHKREVQVEVNFMGREIRLYLGIEMIEAERNG